MIVRSALIQTTSSLDKEENIVKHLELIEEAANQGSQITCLQELFCSPYFCQVQDAKWYSHVEPIPGPTTEKFSELAKQYGVVIVMNLFEREGEKTYDASPVIDADGKLLGVIRMVHIIEGPGFHEKGYYTPGNKKNFVYKTKVGQIGVAICYDRHFPEYMRSLGLKGAEIVIVPQAGAIGEWPKGIFEAELQVAAFQNGYYAALVNRVGKEDIVHFSGESFIVDPHGGIIAQAPMGKDYILYADCDFKKIPRSHAKKHFLQDRRPDFYQSFGLLD